MTFIKFTGTHFRVNKKCLLRTWMLMFYKKMRKRKIIQRINCLKSWFKWENIVDCRVNINMSWVVGFWLQNEQQWSIIEIFGNVWARMWNTWVKQTNHSSIHSQFHNTNDREKKQQILSYNVILRVYIVMSTQNIYVIHF